MVQKITEDDSDKNEEDSNQDTVEEAENAQSEQEVDVDDARPKKKIKLSEVFKKGAIVRIKLKNFVTYDMVEFFAGPNMNMIIGPNGTGKSTIVCAIALGLTGKPELLGRQKELRDFVKRGKESATIEIELKGDEKNYVIRRYFKVIGNKSNWKINGAQASEKDVKNLCVKELNVQVDNLCQFLPQDKVSQFAQMNSQELLKETERAAGGFELLEQHQNIIRLRSKQRAHEHSRGADQQHLDLLKRKNEQLENAVQRYKQREVLLRKCTILKCGVADLFGVEKENYKHCKEVSKALKNKVDGLKEEISPVMERLSFLEDGKNSIIKEINTYESKAKNCHLSIVAEFAEAKNLEIKLTDIRNDIQNWKKKKLEKEAKILKLQGIIKNYNKKLAEYVELLREFGLFDEKENEFYSQPTGEWEALQTTLDDLAEKKQHVSAEIEELINEKESYYKKKVFLTNLEDQKLQEINGLSIPRNRILSFLSDREPSTFKFYNYLKDNHNLTFNYPVLGPVVLEVNVVEKRYKNLVENKIFGSLLDFVAKNDHDYFKCLELARAQGVRVNLSSYGRKNTTLQNYLNERRISNDELKRLGFKGYVSDLIDAEEDILIALCEKAKIHLIPYADNEINRHLIEQNRFFSSYIVKDMVYTINRRYGEISERGDRIQTARYLSESVDADRKKSLETAIYGIRHQIQETQREEDKIDNKITKLKVELSDIDDVMAEAKKKKEELLEAKREYKSILAKKSVIENDLRTEQVSIDFETLSLQKKKEIVLLNEKRKTAVINIMQHQEKLIKSTLKKNKLILERAGLDFLIKDLIKMQEKNKEELENAQRQLLISNSERAKIKSVVEKLSEKAENMWKGLNDAENEEIQKTYLPKSLEEIEEELNKTEALAELADRTTFQTVEEYNARKIEINNLTQLLAEKSKVSNEIDDNLKEVKDKWESELRELIATLDKNFSNTFSAIPEEKDDYEKWGIEILVKFRARDKLQVLNAHRQSGGERSVSTILYLMALQELSKAPFRVVDEINQGMDPRNERMVHSLLVKSACNEGKSQYFLITPKLLPNLEYHERMTIACIYNGMYQPAKFNLREAFDNHKKHASSAAVNDEE
ncbi:Structural maintenance of chromosomes protein 5 [Clydaea vesicula]|uniref:Structural maintenance of chromosomes protein 5 n=1 Tax=Clydaea vesicula TaxID=447962 RepID=A0AAD5XZR7_9FUNG|nr:Structural maintenance of chromosomes protein 5 [Clydaea vesicula]